MEQVRVQLVKGEDDDGVKLRVTRSSCRRSRRSCGCCCWRKSKELDIVVEPQVDGEGAMEEGIGEAGDVWKVGH